LTEEFGLPLVDREPIAPLPETEFERARAQWHTHWAAVDALIVECRRRRSLRFLDALGSYASDQIRYTLPLNGVVRAKLDDAADSFTDKDSQPSRRESALIKCSKTMRALSDQALGQSLGHAQYALNPLREGTASLLTSVLGGGQTMQTIGELRASGRALEAAIELIADFHYLLAHQSWPAEIEAALRGALDLASGKRWRDAADILWNQANAIARTHGSHGESDREENGSHAHDN
jgi:hypothetical protein